MVKECKCHLVIHVSNLLRDHFAFRGRKSSTSRDISEIISKTRAIEKYLLCAFSAAHSVYWEDSLNIYTSLEPKELVKWGGQMCNFM